MAKVLSCHTNDENKVQGVKFKKGKNYPVVRETEGDYTVVNESGVEVDIAKEPNRWGHSYKDWFNVKEDNNA